MNLQVMKMFTYHDYTSSQSFDYGSDKFVTLEQNSINLMIQLGQKKYVV
jgi:hypothetical protein